MKTLIMLLAFGLISINSVAEPLDKDAPEYKQLEAMGYDIEPVSPGDETTIAKSSGSKVSIGKSGDSLYVGRYFIRSKKNLSDADKLKFLSIINDINSDYRYQISLGSTFLTVALFYNGPYNNKVFANMMRQIDMANFIFDKYPELGKYL